MPKKASGGLSVAIYKLVNTYKCCGSLTEAFDELCATGNHKINNKLVMFSCHFVITFSAKR